MVPRRLLLIFTMLYKLFLLLTLRKYLFAGKKKGLPIKLGNSNTTQPAFIYSKLTIEAVEQGVKYVQS